ncbi:hypothetical protein CAPTEDRAFT_226165 [Capitella teleta]|uniref:Uncharacterized protein n=1 Tax=Capitella teleta TaxID=283909 RepID=R7T5Y8_CAPTE|nr:hypothetical protein CAPTEDRAFT_226165 [Capitella teleta]|eukprot:ELT88884.1 hypothetical protein CAPTEDRAFT_226165 [Capitella teleta]
MVENSKMLHMEAQRKRRVLERKREAQMRMAQDSQCQPTYNQSTNGAPMETRPAMQAPNYNAPRPWDLEFMTDFPIKHRHVDNTAIDKVSVLLRTPTQDQEASNERAEMSGSAAPFCRPSSYQVQKELRHQEKVLRNNNLIMGPISAFQEYFEPNAPYGPPRK